MKNFLFLTPVFLCLMLLWTSCEKEQPKYYDNELAFVKILGDNQSDTVHKQLTVPLKIQIQNSLGKGIGAELVTFSTISYEGGCLSSTAVLTDTNGFAETIWTLGEKVGTQKVYVESPNVSYRAVFEAIGIANPDRCLPIFGTMTDSRDGEVYKTVTICSQTWMAENLRYDTPNVSGLRDTLNLNSPSPIYGRLYDWAVIMDLPAVYNDSFWMGSLPHRGICPLGWHVPSDLEWTTLEVSVGLGCGNIETLRYRGSHGTSMKSTTGWSNNGNGTNSSGFNVFPAGGVYSGFGELGSKASFWSSTAEIQAYPYAPSNEAYSRGFYNDKSQVYRNDYFSFKKDGGSCRCIKD